MQNYCRFGRNRASDKAKDFAMNRLLVDVKELAEMLGVSTRQVWRGRDSGHFPQPLQIGGRKCLRWDAATVAAWIADGAPHVRRTGWRGRVTQ